MINIHHIAIICSEREAALDFYSRKLGFPVIRENYREERDDWKIDLRINDSTELELFIMKGFGILPFALTALPKRSGSWKPWGYPVNRSARIPSRENR